MTGYKVTAIYPTLVVNKGEVVSLQAEAEVFPDTSTEQHAIREFRDIGPIQAVNYGPWVHTKNAVAYLVREIT